ncbi:hypothetical protein LPY66_13595 [Dehalobacter sp. DCM]|uniref:hypothetical protein n=1 Tax=Dehalobacter sp. DCM TaxID=2907827 RepID=UPI003081A350|nr:hypothetical protein LPY66_13595 [Dehalobacter sp. DCM]
MKKRISIIFPMIFVILIIIFSLSIETKNNIYIEKPINLSSELSEKEINRFMINDILWNDNIIIFQYENSNSESKYGSINIYNYLNDSQSELYSFKANINTNVHYINKLNDEKFYILSDSDIIIIDSNTKRTTKININDFLENTQWSYVDENKIAGISSNARYIVTNVIDNKNKSSNIIIIDSTKNSIDTAINKAELLSVKEDKVNNLFMLIKSENNFSLLKYNYATGEYINIPNVYYYYISHDNKYIITIEGGTYVIREINDPQKVIKRFGYNTELFGKGAVFVSNNYYIDSFPDGIKAYKLGTHEPIEIAKISGNIYFSVSPDKSSIIIYNFDQDDPLSGTLRSIDISNLLDR